MRIKTTAMAVIGLLMGASTVPAQLVSNGFTSVPAVNGQAVANGGSFAVNPANDPLSISRTSTTPERRGILEFSLPALPPMTDVQSASLAFTVNLFTASSNNGVKTNPVVALYGYAGNNAIEVSDATQTTNLLATQEVFGLERYTVPLSTTLIQTLINNGASSLGILGVQNQILQTQIVSSTTASPTSPRLTVDYVTLPEPSTAALFAVAGCIAARRRSTDRTSTGK